MKIKTVIQINQPIAKVFRYLTNARNMREWVMGLQQVKPVKGNRPTKGSISTQVFKDEKGLLEVKEEVLKFQKNELFKLKLSHKNMETIQSYTFTENEAGTKLTINTTTKLIPAFIGIFSFFMKGQMRRQQEDDLKKLKQLLER